MNQQWVDVRYLASSHAKTPDFRQENPPVGQILITSWRIPKEILNKHAEVVLEVLFWDYTKKIIHQPIDKKMDFFTFRLLDEEYEKSGGILTYQSKIVTEEGEIFREWKHQLWVELITIE